jgi:hypothetical protein
LADLGTLHWDNIDLARNEIRIETRKTGKRLAIMIAMEGARAGARQRARQKRTGQLDLLAASDLHDTSHFDFLRNTFLSRAEKAIREKIVSVKRVLYDELWSLAMRFPVVWPKDVNAYLREWNNSGAIAFENMPHGTRTPKLGSDITLVLKNKEKFV